MNPETTARVRAQGAAILMRVREFARRVPTAAWAVLGLFLFAAVLMAFHSAISKDATLRMKVQHGFRSAQLYVWVDGDQVYSGKLTGYARKRFGVLPDSVQGSLSETLAVSSGSHQVRVRVAADDGSVEEDVIRGDFSSDNPRSLLVSARHGDVSLNWQGETMASNDSPSDSSWLSRYAGMLLLTVAGSIVSALTGYAIKEIPNHLRPRQDPAPRV